jgi:CelD/BcsL family acetyltransferase involved in cellulose biosynthesis
VDVEVLGDGERLAALRPEWNALVAGSSRPRPLLTHEWFTTAVRHFGRGEFAVVCFRDGGRLVGLAPLRSDLTRVAGLPPLRRLQFAVDVADCRDVIAESGAEWPVVESLYEWLASASLRWDLLRLRGLCSHSPTHDYLPLLATHAGLAATAWRTAPCANIHLPPSMDEFLEQMPNRRRCHAYLQKGRKLLREHGPLSLRVARGPEISEADLDLLCNLHHGSWQSRGGSNVLVGTFCGFIRSLTAALAPTGQTLLAFLRVGDREVAAQYGFLIGQRFFLYVVGFDSEFASYSVGSQALLTLVEHGITHGWTEIDLMNGGEQYKFDFTRHCCRAADVWIARNARLLRLACAVAALRGRARL